MNNSRTLLETKERLEFELKQINERIAEASSEEIPKMLTIREASRETGLSYNHIRSLCSSGKIVFIRAGNRILINRRKLIDYLNSGKEHTHDSCTLGGIEEG